MKVTIVCDVLGEPNNGTTLAAYNLIGYLREAGHEVTVVCADSDKRGKEGYRVVPTRKLGPLNLILKANGVTALAKPDKRVLAEALAGADVVHILLPFTLGVAAMKIAKERGIPVTASFHAQAENFSAHIFCMNNALVNHATYRMFYRHLYRYVDRVHYPTRFIKETFEREIKTQLPSEVISNGVNDAFFLPHESERLSNKFTILCTGRFSGEKAQQTLIKAVSRSPMRSDIKLYFAGCGPKQRKLARLAKRKGVDADFHFYSREELLRVLHGADLYVHTAVVEIEAISCLEAIVSGLVPIICNSERSATRNFAIGEHCLFKEGSSKDLAEKIAFFYRNPERIAEYRRKYASFRDRYRQKDCMKRMEEMLREAAKKKA